MVTKINKISIEQGTSRVGSTGKPIFKPYTRLIVRQKLGQSVYTASTDLSKKDARYLVRALASLIV